MDYNLKATYRSGRQYFFLKGADSGWLEFGQMTKFTYSFLLQPNLTQGKKLKKIIFLLYFFNIKTVCFDFPVQTTIPCQNSVPS